MTAPGSELQRECQRTYENGRLNHRGDRLRKVNKYCCGVAAVMAGPMLGACTVTSNYFVGKVIAVTQTLRLPLFCLCCAPHADEVHGDFMIFCREDFYLCGWFATLQPPPPYACACGNVYVFDIAAAKSADRDFEYRKRLAVILPTLTQIDATGVVRG